MEKRGGSVSADAGVKVLAVFTVIAMVVLAGAVYITFEELETQRSACKQRGGVPVTFREGIVCFSPGVVK